MVVRGRILRFIPLPTIPLPLSPFLFPSTQTSSGYISPVDALLLHEFHQNLGARFLDLNGMEAVEDYGDALAEHAALRESAGLLDLGFRGRLCLLGADRRS